MFRVRVNGKLTEKRAKSRYHPGHVIWEKLEKGTTYLPQYGHIFDPITYDRYSVQGHDQLIIVDLSMEVGDSIPWYKALFTGRQKARYVGFFELNGIGVQEFWDTGAFDTATSSELREMLQVFNQTVNEYLENNALIRCSSAWATFPK